MTSTIISSQRFLDEEKVADKLAARDFIVSISPAFVADFGIDGATYQVVLDGHHSLAAAKIAGVDAEFVTVDESEHDAVALLAAGKVDDFLAVTYIDSDYYNVETGNDL
jgi:hypothetical protein